MLSCIRRIRTSDPTCLSIALGAFFAPGFAFVVLLFKFAMTAIPLTCLNKKRPYQPSVGSLPIFSIIAQYIVKSNTPRFCAGLEPSSDAADGLDCVVEGVPSREGFVLRMQVRLRASAAAL